MRAWTRSSKKRGFLPRGLKESRWRVQWVLSRRRLLAECLGDYALTDDAQEIVTPMNFG
jgi:hypothetical protein